MVEKEHYELLVGACKKAGERRKAVTEDYSTKMLAGLKVLQGNGYVEIVIQKPHIMYLVTKAGFDAVEEYKRNN